jgi:hypothetical protein
MTWPKKGSAFSVSTEVRRLIASAGGHSTIARFGADAIAERARSGLWQRYLDRVDPDRQLPEPERVERAEHLRRADMKLMTAKRVQAPASQEGEGGAARQGRS